MANEETAEKPLGTVILRSRRRGRISFIKMRRARFFASLRMTGSSKDSPPRESLPISIFDSNCQDLLYIEMAMRGKEWANSTATV